MAKETKLGKLSKEELATVMQLRQQRKAQRDAEKKLQEREKRAKAEQLAHEKAQRAIVSRVRKLVGKADKASTDATAGESISELKKLLSSKWQKNPQWIDMLRSAFTAEQRMAAMVLELVDATEPEPSAVTVTSNKTVSGAALMAQTVEEARNRRAEKTNA